MKRIDVRTAYAIAHHKADVSAHHVKYTDPEAVLALYGYEGIYWQTYFESLDGYNTEITGASTAVVDGLKLRLATGAQPNDEIILYKSPNAMWQIPSIWNKKRRFKVRSSWASGYNVELCEFNLVMGYSLLWGTALRHAGFKLVEDELYGTVADGTTESELNLGTVVGSHTLEAIFTPATDCSFYLDGVYQGKLETNLPSGDDAAEIFMCVAVKTLTTAEKSFTLSDWRFLQEP